MDKKIKLNAKTDLQTLRDIPLNKETIRWHEGYENLTDEEAEAMLLELDAMCTFFYEDYLIRLNNGETEF